MFEAFLQMESDQLRTVPFLNKLNIFNSEIELYADSAGSANFGFGCLFQEKWCQGMWHNTPLFNNGYKPNIALLELFVIVIAVDLWALELLGKAITL